MKKDIIKQFYQENLSPIDTPPDHGNNQQPVGDQSDINENASYMGVQQQQQDSAGAGSNTGDEFGPVLKPELPSGGGAIQGYGDQFQAEGFTGGASLSFGGQSYNTGAGNGPFGMGFGAGGMGEVSRRVSHGNPTYDEIADVHGDTLTDQFLLNGEVLVRLLDDDGNPVKYDGYLDRFSSGGLNDWQMPTTSDYTGSKQYVVWPFKPMSEGAYTKIQYWRWNPESGKNHEDHEPLSCWMLWQSDNSLTILGADSDHQIYNPEDDPNNPDEPARIFKWCFTESLDAEGRSTYVAYKRENDDNIDNDIADESAHGPDTQLYIEKVYSGHDQPFPAPLCLAIGDNFPDWFFITVYDYGEYDIHPKNQDPYGSNIGAWDMRQDPFSSFFGGFEIRTRRLCKHVLRFHQFVELNPPNESNVWTPRLVMATSYDYQQGKVCTLMRASNQKGYHYRSTPKEIDGIYYYYDINHEVPIEMEYTRFELPEESTAEKSVHYRELMREYPEGNLAPFSSIGGGLDFTPVDLYAEGIEGFLFADGDGYKYFQTSYDYVQEKPKLAEDGVTPIVVYKDESRTNDLPLNRLVSDEFHSFQDLTGNGELDYVVSRRNMMGYYEVDQEGQWSDFNPLPTYATESENPRSKLINVCGDGRSDCVMFMNESIRYYKNNGASGFESGKTVPSNLPSNIESSEDTLFIFAGIAGDGRSHLIRVTHNELVYWPNYGYGVFGDPITMENFPDDITYDEFKTNRVFFADVDGTGTADMLIFGTDGIRLYLNRSGNSFGEAIEIPLPEGEQYDRNDQIMFADVYGIGMTAMIYSKTHSTPRQWVFDFSKGMKPYLMNKHINNIGATSELYFKSSVHDYLEDLNPNNLNDKEYRAWYTRAPFPTWVLRQMTTEDAISGSTLSQSYRYRDSYYDGIEREFRGFGYVEHRDTDNFDSNEPLLDSPPSVLKSWFHTGNPNQQTICDKYIASDYFSGDSEALYLPSTYVMYDGIAYATPGDDVPTEIWRQASILMKGSLLHSELYGLDEEHDEETLVQLDHNVPYQAENANAQILFLQPEGVNSDGDNINYYASFQKLPRESLNYLYERNSVDPKMTYGAVLQFDKYGHEIQSCSIIYDRREGAQTYVEDLTEEQTELRCYVDAVLIDNFSTNEGDKEINSSDVFYMLGVPVELQAFAIVGLQDLMAANGYLREDNEGNMDQYGMYQYDDLKEALVMTMEQGKPYTFDSEPFNDDPAAVTGKLHSWARVFYWYASYLDEDDLVFGNFYLKNVNRVGSRGFLIEHSKNQAVYQASGLEAIIGQYKDTTEFNKMMAATDEGGGVYQEYEGYWWATSGISGPGNSSKFYQIISYQSPRGDVSYMDFDDHNLIVVKGTDALDNVVQIKWDQEQNRYMIDYQHLKPLALWDYNNNTSEVLYDALGRVIATSHYGDEYELTVDFANENQIDSVYGRVGFDSLYDGSYEIRHDELDPIKVLLADPSYYLQSAQNFFHYSPFSWMVDTAKLDFGFTSEGLDNFYWELQKQGLITIEGAIYYYFHKLIAACENVSVFSSALGCVNAKLQAYFEALESNQQTIIFDKYKDDLDDPRPVHVLAMAAEDYPNRCNALLSKQDYIYQIPLINVAALGTWFISLSTNLYIKPTNYAFMPKFRNLIQASDSIGAFEAALEEPSKAVFAAFTEEQQDQILELLKYELTTRIQQMVNYNDGFGRALQTKVKSDDRVDSYLYENKELNPNESGSVIHDVWLTHGLTVYNNKSQVVRQYDPFFVNTVDFIENKELYQIGTSPTNYYDALGRVTHSYSAKGFLVYHRWTPWGQTVWDPNDILMISPYFIINKTNIYDPSSATPPNTTNPFAQYYDDTMTDADREALKKVLTQGWTPAFMVEDNRSLVWKESSTNMAKYTPDTMEQEPLSLSSENASDLYQELLDTEYLDMYNSYEMDDNYDPQDINWGYLTAKFPFVDVIDNLNGVFDNLPDRYRLMFKSEAPKIISLLYGAKLSGTAITAASLPNDFTSAFGYSPFDSAECSILWQQLSDKKLLGTDNIPTDKIVFPILSEINFPDYGTTNSDVVNYIMLWYASGELYTNNMLYDDLNRLTHLADPRFSDANVDSNNVDPIYNLIYSYSGDIGPVVQQNSCDAGISLSIPSVFGRPIWELEARMVETRIYYDELIRPMYTNVSLITSENGWGPITVTRIAYGDQAFVPKNPTPEQLQAAREEAQKFNFIMRPVQVYTQGGWTSVVQGYNVLGLPQGGLTKFAKPYAPVSGDVGAPGVLQPIIDVPVLDNLNPFGRDDDSDLKSQNFQGYVLFDANNQLVDMMDPAGNLHQQITWQEGGLRMFTVNGVNYMDNILYNSKGQHLSTEYYNEDKEHLLTTLYAYDKFNYRLLQIFTQAADDTNPLIRETEYAQIVSDANNVRQNLIYSLDPIGNVMEVDGMYQAPEEGQDPDLLTEFPVSGEYKYDALYRMVSATGYEQEEETLEEVGEMGQVELSSDWIVIGLKKTYVKPVVVVSAFSSNDPEPVVVRVQNVTESSFEAKLQRWYYNDDTTPSAETVSYMVVEEGIHTLQNGKIIEAGVAKSPTRIAGWTSVALQGSFAQTPLIFSSIDSYAGPDPVVIRSRLISESGFDFRIQEQMVNASNTHHAIENIGYIAISNSSNEEASIPYEVGLLSTNQVGDEASFTTKTGPVVMAAMQSFAGSHPCNVRYDNITDSSVKLYLSEEGSNNETVHVNEEIGYLVFDQGGVINGVIETTSIEASTF